MVCLHTGTMGVHLACFFIVRAGEVASPGPESHRKTLLLSYASSLSSRTNWRALGILVTSYCEEKKGIEIAKLLGVSPQTISRRLPKALDKLTDIMRQR